MHLFIQVNHGKFLPSSDPAGEIERERARDSCRNQLQLRLLHIFQVSTRYVCIYIGVRQHIWYIRWVDYILCARSMLYSLHIYTHTLYNDV